MISVNVKHHVSNTSAQSVPCRPRGCLVLGWLFAEIVSVLVGVRQDYRIIVSVLVGVLKGLSYYSQCVSGCLRTIVL